MRTLIVFILVITLVFAAGALLSYPLYACLTPITDIGFDKILHYSVLLTGLTLGVYYLHTTRQLGDMLGQGRGAIINLKLLGKGYVAGILILLLIEASLYLLNMRQPDPDLDEGLLQLLIAVLKAIMTGLTVGLLEETLYRGAIFTGLARYSSRLTALLISSLFYGAVHFIDFQAPPPGADINWLTGFNLLAASFNSFADIFILDSLSSLVLLGLLLGMLRWHTGNIILCIGVHAGIVSLNKIFAYATDYRPGTSYAFLVNIYDHQTGVLASLWLVLACTLFYRLYLKKTSPGKI